MRSNSSALSELAFTRVGRPSSSGFPRCSVRPKGRLARTAEALPRVEGWDTAGQDNLEDQQNQRFVKERLPGEGAVGGCAAAQDQTGQVCRAEPVVDVHDATPEAQELSMARRAARPWKAAP